MAALLTGGPWIGLTNKRGNKVGTTNGQTYSSTYAVSNYHTSAALSTGAQVVNQHAFFKSILRAQLGALMRCVLSYGILAGPITAGIYGWLCYFSHQHIDPSALTFAFSLPIITAMAACWYMRRWSKAFLEGK